MTTLNASDARIPPDAFNDVVFRGERIGIRRRDGKEVYLVSAEDIRLLEVITDQLDAADAREALARHEASGRKTVSLSTLKKRLGR